MENISITSIDGFAKKLCSITSESAMYTSGKSGYTIRVVPRAVNATNSLESGYIDGSYSSSVNYVVVPKGTYCLNYDGSD